MPENNKSLLHQSLRDQKLYTKDFPSFEEQFSTHESQDLLHQDLVGRKLYTKDLSAFQGQFFNGVAKKKVATTTGGEKGLFDPLDEPAGPPEEGVIGTGEVIAAQEQQPPPEQQEQAVEPTTKQGRFTSFLGSINQRFYGLPGEALKAIAIGGSKIESLIEGKELNAQEDPFYKVGQWYQDQVEEIAPRNKEYQGELQESIGQAIGDLAGLVVGGGIARAATTGSQMAVLAKQAGVPVVEAAKMVAKGMISPEGIIGATQMGVSEYEQAKEGGASDADAFDLFIKNAAVGSVLERMPVQLFWRRLDTVTGGGMKTLLKKGFSGGMEEGITEIMQQAYSNKQAQQVYDETRNIIDGMGEAGGIGFGLGFVLNAMGVRLRGLKSEATSKEDIAKIQEAIDLTLEKQTEVNKEADEITEAPPPVEPEVTEEVTEEVVPEEVITEPEVVVEPEPEVVPEVTKEPTESDKLFKRGQEIQRQATEIKEKWHTKQGKFKKNTPKSVIAEAQKISSEFNEVQKKYKESLPEDGKRGPYAQKVMDLGEQERALVENPTQEGYDAFIQAETDFFLEGHLGTPESSANQARFESRLFEINEKVEGDFKKVDPEEYVEAQYQELIKKKPKPKKVPEAKSDWREAVNKKSDPFDKGDILLAVAEVSKGANEQSDILDASRGLPIESKIVWEIINKKENQDQNIKKVLEGDFSDFTKDQVSHFIKNKEPETKPVETEKVQKAKQEIEETLKEELKVATGKVVLETQDYIPIKNLKGKEVKMKVEVEETGKMETITMSAIEVQTDIKKRHKILEQLTDCVK